jgi:hypothetical protein
MQIKESLVARRHSFTNSSMRRAFFFSLGTFVILAGIVTLGVDRVVLNLRAESGPKRVLDMLTSITNDGLRVAAVPEWMPFTLIGVGGVTALYTLALPKARVARR